MKNIFLVILCITAAYTSAFSRIPIERDTIPIIYSKKYNIRFYGFQKLHPFDSEKYGKVYKYLKRQVDFNNTEIYSPKIVSKNELLFIHSEEYLESLNDKATIAKIAEMPPLRYLPLSLLHKKLLKPMQFATGGTLLGVDVAMKHGFAINLSGGYHHAKSGSGGGFCFYADINLAIDKILKRDSTKHILIIDLDAHQGNGHEAIAGDNPNIHILDVYNKDIYPMDYSAKQFIEFEYPIKSHTGDSLYLHIIHNSVEKAINEVQPDFIIYNAGTDIYKSDPLGGLDLTEKAIVERDEIVFQYSIAAKIPILMLLSGGYSKESAKIIGKSVKKLLLKYEFQQ